MYRGTSITVETNRAHRSRPSSGAPSTVLLRHDNKGIWVKAGHGIDSSCTFLLQKHRWAILPVPNHARLLGTAYSQTRIIAD
jgi:hypothetical protein